MSAYPRRIEEALKANCTTSAKEITLAVTRDFAAQQGAIARVDDVTAPVF
jgi:hypothetical protein